HDDGRTGTDVRGHARRTRAGCDSHARMGTRAILRRDRAALGAAIAQHPDTGHRRLLSRHLSDRRHEPFGGPRHHHAVRAWGAAVDRPRLAGKLRTLDLPGIAFREAGFSPTFDRHAGERVNGVQLHVTDVRSFDPLRTAVSILDVVTRTWPDAIE